jgi:hypothetical protein
MNKIIIILAEARSGSSLLIEAMNYYSPIQNMYEYFPVPGFDTSTDEYYSHISDAFYLLEELRTSVNVPVFMKVQNYQLYQLNLEDRNKLISLPFVEVVLLERTNRFETFVSKEQAEQVNSYSMTNTDNVLIDFKPNKFFKFNRESTSFYDYTRKFLKNIGKNYLEVSYEQDLLDFSQEKIYSKFDPWFEKIGITLDHVNHNMKFVKQRTVPAVACIKNYSECQRLIELINK